MRVRVVICVWALSLLGWLTAVGATKVVVRPRPLPSGKPVLNHHVPQDVRDRVGARLVAEYDSFTVLAVPQSQISQLRAEAEVRNEDIEAHPEWAELILPGRSVRTDEKQKLSSIGGEALFVVQFIGPETPAWYEAVAARGAKVVNHLAYNGALIWTSSAQAERIRRCRSSSSSPSTMRR